MIVNHLEALFIIAKREVLEHLKSKRLLITGGLYMAFLILGLVLFASIPEFGNARSQVSPLEILMFLHQFFPGFLFVSLLGILLLADAVSGEWKDRTLILLFTRPVSRWTVLTGKFIGGLVALYVVTLIGITVGLVGGIFIAGMPSGAEWGHFLRGTGWLMFALLGPTAFGLFLSVVFRSPTTSFIVGVLMKFIGFVVLAQLALLIEFARGNRDPFGSDLYFLFGFLDPDRMVRLTAQQWIPGTMDEDGPVAAVRSLGDQFGWGALAIVVHLFLYFGVSYLMVAKRDYP